MTPPRERAALALPVVAEQVTCAFARAQGVFDLDLSLEPGEVVGLLGPNGSGKSTLLSILGTIRAPGTGRVRWFGLQDRESPRVRRRIGVALDTPAHFEDLTGYQNAWFFARQFGVPRAIASGRLEAMLDWAGLWEARDQPVRQYSLGMRRRLGLVEALVHRPDLLLLDEPTLALDYRGELDLIEALRTVAGDGAAVLVATNDVHLAERLCSRVLFLHQGRVVKRGPVPDLLAEMAITQELELRVRSPIDLRRLWSLPGVEAAGADNGRIRIVLGQGAQAARVLAGLGRDADLITEMRLVRPDLGDLFLRLTGVTLGCCSEANSLEGAKV